MYLRVRDDDKVPTLFQTLVFLKSISENSYTEYQENIQLVCINLDISFNSHNITMDFKF
jgi:predicted transcriptional regulator YheO